MTLIKQLMLPAGKWALNPYLIKKFSLPDVLI